MKNKLKGFTLVELIIVIVLLAILMAMVGMMFKPMAQLFADSTKYTEDRYVMDGIDQVIQENIKYADNVAIYYDYALISTLDGWVGHVASSDFNVANDRIYTLAIVNVPDGLSTHPDTDFIDNSGYYNSCRIYKSAVLDKSTGVREEWLVGGEAFYGGASYFVNLETTSGTMLAPGDFNYTIYSFDKTKSNKDGNNDKNTNTLVGQALTFLQMRNLSKQDIQTLPGTKEVNDNISNYLESGVRFVNSPKTNFIADPTNSMDPGHIYPISGEFGASDALGNAKVNAISDNPGYNIYIFYTLPSN